MSGREVRRSLRGFLVFAALATLVAATVAIGGASVAWSRAGAGVARAWIWGSGVSLAASMISGVLVAARSTLGLRGVTLALGTMLLRLSLLAVLGVAVGWLLALDVRPFLLALVASHLALLVVDTGYVLRVAASL